MQDCRSCSFCLPWTLGSSSNIASLNLFYRYYSGRCSCKLAQLIPRPYSRERSIRFSVRLHDFCVITSRYYKYVYVNSFVPHIARLWNSLLIECFPLTYDLNGFKSRNNRHPLTTGMWSLFINLILKMSHYFHIKILNERISKWAHLSF